MILVRMSQYQILQLFHPLLSQIALQFYSLCIIPAIDHHGIFSAENQSGIPMPHIQKVYLQRPFRFYGISGISPGFHKKQAQQRRRAKKQQQESSPLFAETSPTAFSII